MKNRNVAPAHRKVAKLDHKRAFFYELPNDTTPAELTQYERHYATKYDNFHCRVGNRIYFLFQTTAERDMFMLAKERGCQKDGTITGRVIIPDVPTSPGSFYKPVLPGWGTLLDWKNNLQVTRQFGLTSLL